MFSKYEYVYQVYKEHNFTKAAEKLFISQPSLSAAIKKIEEKVGAELFERRGKGIELTEVGKEYIATTEQIIKAENEFKKNSMIFTIWNRDRLPLEVLTTFHHMFFPK